jgi:prolyl-tRNA synthetase
MSQEEGITAKKYQNFSEWYTQVVDRADLADTRYNVQGFIVHKTWSTRIIREIVRLFERELENAGHEPVLFPTVIPEENLKKEGDHFGFVPEVFWVTERGQGEKMEKKLALRPTSETAFYQMYSLWIRSWRDLPMKKYQSVTAFRNEPTTRPFLRGREFVFVEAHDAFETREEALAQIEKDRENMRSVIWERLGIPVMFFKRPPWDRFLGAEETYTTDVLLPDGRVVQVGSTHDLGQKFSKPFGIKFTDRNGNENFVWQTCYGPGIWRMFAALVSVHGDDRGLVLPFEIAPIQIVIVPIFYDDDGKKDVLKKAESLSKKLSKKYRVHVDLTQKTPGEKYHHWEMFGVPFRIEIGSKEAGGGFCTVCRRDTMKKDKVTDKALSDHIERASMDMLESLKKKAREWLDSRIYSPKNRHDFLRDVSKGGIVRAPFCGTEDCARNIQNETGGTKVRGVSTEKVEKAMGNCIYCTRSAKQIAYMAKQY